MSWSGGKDSACALRALQAAGEYEVVSLLTSVSEEYRRVSHHGVREVLLQQQAEAIGVPLDIVYLPSQASGAPCTNEVYEALMGGVMERYRARGVRRVAFGDLFLEDLRAYRERNLARAGMEGVFPLWGRDTTALAREVIATGFRSYLSCVEGRVGEGFAGREYDAALLAMLPAHVDPCGEYGEFHTFVFDGPIFAHPVDVRVGEVVTRDGRYYADLVPARDAEGDRAGAVMPPVLLPSGPA